jgi:predicted secreted protein
LSVTFGIFVYLIIWWAVLFAVLPIGVKRQENPEPGTDPGAPEQPMLLKKALITTVISGVVFAGVYWLMVSDYLTFRPR